RTEPRDIVLRALREAKEVSQEKLADMLGISQVAVSNIERRGDVRLSTLRRVIRALGGEVEVLARFQDEKFRLRLPESARREESSAGAEPLPPPARRPAERAAAAGKKMKSSASARLSKTSGSTPSHAGRPGSGPRASKKVQKSSRRARP